MSRNRRYGFTLLELLIVVVILGVLAAIVIPRVTANTGAAKRVTCAQNVARINELVEKWHLDKGEWPLATLEDIAADPNYFPDGIPKCPVSGTKYALGKETHRVVCIHLAEHSTGLIEKLISPILP